MLHVTLDLIKQDILIFYMKAVEFKYGNRGWTEIYILQQFYILK